MNNIALIGMPGAGKSTIGHILAKMLDYSYVDTDKLICDQSGLSLHEILQAGGRDALQAIEEQVICGLNLDHSVISTGGSAIYSTAGMTRLQQISKVVYLRCELNVVLERIGDGAQRGIMKRPGQSIEDLFEERKILYRHYADLTIDSSAGSPEDVARKIIDMLELHAACGAERDAG